MNSAEVMTVGAVLRDENCAWGSTLRPVDFKPGSYALVDDLLYPFRELPICKSAFVQPLQWLARFENLDSKEHIACPEYDEEYADRLFLATERWIEGRREEPFESCWWELGEPEHWLDPEVRF